MASPLEQFEVKPLVNLNLAGFDVSFTNSALYMVISAMVVVIFVYLGGRNAKVLPSRMQAAMEISYNFIVSLLKGNAGDSGRPFFPFFYTLFMFFLAGNLIGLVPGTYTFNAQVIVPFVMAGFVVVLSFVVGLKNGGVHYLHHFFPKGVPLILAPIIVPIEIISFLSRSVSLSMRLFANLTAGHVMMKVIAGFVLGLGVAGGFVPIIANAVLLGFELLMSSLHTFIFTVLSCVYVSESLKDEH